MSSDGKSTWLKDTAEAFALIPIDEQGIHVGPFLDACQQIHPVYDIIFGAGLVSGTLKGVLTKHMDSVNKRYQARREHGVEGFIAAEWPAVCVRNYHIYCHWIRRCLVLCKCAAAAHYLGNLLALIG